MIASLGATWTADTTTTGAAVDRAARAEGAPARLPLTLAFLSKPVGATPTGTIAINCKLQHSVDNVTWEDVASGAVTQITIGTVKSEAIVIPATAKVYRWVRIIASVAITGTPVYQTGITAIAHLLES